MNLRASRLIKGHNITDFGVVGKRPSSDAHFVNHSSSVTDQVGCTVLVDFAVNGVICHYTIFKPKIRCFVNIIRRLGLIIAIIRIYHTTFVYSTNKESVVAFRYKLN